MAYNVTILNNQTNIQGIFNELNTISNGLIGNMLLLTIFIIVLTSMRESSGKVRFIVASFVTSAIGFLMFLGSIIAFETVIVILVILIASIFYYIASK